MMMKVTFQLKFTAWLNSACTSTACGGGTNMLQIVTPSSTIGIRQSQMLVAQEKEKGACALFSIAQFPLISEMAHKMAQRLEQRRDGRLETRSPEDQHGEMFTTTVSCTMTTWTSLMILKASILSLANAKISTTTLRTKKSLKNLTTETKPILNCEVY